LKQFWTTINVCAGYAEVYWSTWADRWLLPIESMTVHMLPMQEQLARAAGLPFPYYTHVPSRGEMRSMAGNGMVLETARLSARKQTANHTETLVMLVGLRTHNCSLACNNDG
jgi:hypothetical protein